jgi:7-cyano-7-deazaguanine synthase
MSKCVVIFSGGLDSTVLLHYCLTEFEEVYCLTYNYNQRHKIEINKALDYTSNLGVGLEQKIRQHTVVDLTFYAQLANSSALTNPDIDVPKMKDIVGHPQNAAHVPNRNMTMLSIAAAYAEAIGAKDVYYGAALIDDISGHWDGTKEFLNLLNTTLALNRKQAVRVSAPLMVKTKAEIIQWGLELGVDFSKTHTCYQGVEVACGTCPACASRIQGFLDASFIDPISYAKEIPWQAFKCKPIMS